MHGAYRAHLGVDYGAPVGTAVHGGRVRRRRVGGLGGRGRPHGPAASRRRLSRRRTCTSRRSRPAFDVGARVEQGELIGRVGMTRHGDRPAPRLPDPQERHVRQSARRAEPDAAGRADCRGRASGIHAGCATTALGRADDAASSDALGATSRRPRLPVRPASNRRCRVSVPFRALRPAPEVAARVASVPYDVVNTEEARALAAGNPLSFLHVTRSEIDLPPRDESVRRDASTRRPRATSRSSKRAAPLVQDDEPSLYFYRLRMGAHEQTGVAGLFLARRVRRAASSRSTRRRARTRKTTARGTSRSCARRRASCS